MVYIDGIKFAARWVSNTFTEKAEIVNGDNSTRLQGNKDMYLEYVGTFFNFSGELVREKRQPWYHNDTTTDLDWDNLFKRLSSPYNKHTIRFPHDQGYLECEVYISSIERTLRFCDKENDRNKWDSVYKVQFVPVKSQWLAGKNIKGYTPRIDQ